MPPDRIITVGPGGVSIPPISGQRNRAAGLADQVGVDGEFTHCRANLVLRHRDQFIDHLLQMRESQRGWLRSQAVGDRAVAVIDGPIHPFTPPKTLCGVGGEFGLDPEDLGFWARCPDSGTDTGRQAAPTHRDQHVLHLRQVLGDLQADRALPRDHIRMVERRYQYAAGLFQHLGGHLLALAGSAQHHLCAVAAGGLHLDVRGLARHHDVGPCSERRCRAGDCLSVVSARVRHHTSRAIRFGQVGDGVEGAANLECADRLQVLRLDPERTLRIGPSRRNQLGPDDGVLDPVGRCLDVLDRDQLHGSSVPNAMRRHGRSVLMPSSPRTIRSAITSSSGVPAR